MMNESHVVSGQTAHSQIGLKSSTTNRVYIPANLQPGGPATGVRRGRAAHESAGKAGAPGTAVSSDESPAKKITSAGYPHSAVSPEIPVVD